MPWVVNFPKFWIWQSSEFGIWQGFQNASVTKPAEYNRKYLDRVLNISWVLNMPAFWIWQGSEYARITQGSKYATIWLNMSEQDVNMPEYVRIFNSWQGSEYEWYNT